MMLVRERKRQLLFTYMTICTSQLIIQAPLSNLGTKKIEVKIILNIDQKLYTDVYCLRNLTRYVKAQYCYCFVDSL